MVATAQALAVHRITRAGVVLGQFPFIVSPPWRLLNRVVGPTFEKPLPLRMIPPLVLVCCWVGNPNGGAVAALQAGRPTAPRSPKG
jgi:hypothetical protein